MAGVPNTPVPKLLQKNLKLGTGKKAERNRYCKAWKSTRGHFMGKSFKMNEVLLDYFCWNLNRNRKSGNWTEWLKTTKLAVRWINFGRKKESLLCGWDWDLNCEIGKSVLFAALWDRRWEPESRYRVYWEEQNLRTQKKGNVKQEQIRGKGMSHCIVASRKWIYNFLLLQATWERMQDFKQGRKNSARETGKLSKSLTVCNKTQGRSFNADSWPPLEANWSWIQTRNNTLRKMASQS